MLVFPCTRVCPVTDTRTCSVAGPLAPQALLSQQLVQDAASLQSVELGRVLADDGDASARLPSRQVAFAVRQGAQQAVVLIGWKVVPARTRDVESAGCHSPGFQAAEWTRRGSARLPATAFAKAYGRRPPTDFDSPFPADTGLARTLLDLPGRQTQCYRQPAGAWGGSGRTVPPRLELQVTSLSFLRNGLVPPDCSMTVSASPTRALPISTGTAALGPRQSRPLPARGILGPRLDTLGVGSGDL